jgi:AraC-like DNA-binding protein
MPYLSVVLKLDLELLAQLTLDARPQLPQVPEPSRPGVALGQTTAALLEAVDRLIGLLDEPDLIAVIAPLIRREIFFRVLRGDGGAHLLQLAIAGSRRQRIDQAIDWLKANFREPLRVERLAALADMSPSRFHHHFRQFTAMSPLQFQKWLRVMEARRLMVTQGLGASSAALNVGYGSVSQFSREYARQFGSPPRRDVEGLLQLPRLSPLPAFPRPLPAGPPPASRWPAAGAAACWAPPARAHGTRWMPVGEHPAPAPARPGAAAR